MKRLEPEAIGMKMKMKISYFKTELKPNRAFLTVTLGFIVSVVGCQFM